jgi:hypothetical protein
MTSNRDQIEFDDPTFGECDCCGSKTTNLVRFVTRDGAAFAVYKAAFSDTPDHDWISLIAGFGDWGEDAPPSQRIAFVCRLWNDGTNHNVGIIDRQESYWAATEYLGRILSRSEALRHPLLRELFDLTDHIVICDRPIVEFLDPTSSASSNLI